MGLTKIEADTFIIKAQYPQITADHILNTLAGEIEFHLPQNVERTGNTLLLKNGIRTSTGTRFQQRFQLFANYSFEIIETPEEFIIRFKGSLKAAWKYFIIITILFSLIQGIVSKSIFGFLFFFIPLTFIFLIIIGFQHISIPMYLERKRNLIEGLAKRI